MACRRRCRHDIEACGNPGAVSPALVDPPRLYRGLGRFDVISLTINSVVGAGVFAMPAGLAISSGRWSLAVVFAAFVVVALLALTLAEVASRFDVTGGPQYYAQVTFGPLSGFTVGWLFSLSSLASTALIAQVMLDYAAALWPTIAGTLAARMAAHRVHDRAAVVNVRSVTRGAWVGNLLTIAKMLPLGLVALAGLWFAGWNDIPATEPRQPDGLSDALQIAIFACVGFHVAAVVAGEMRDPRRDLADQHPGRPRDCLPALPSADARLLSACCRIRPHRRCRSWTSRKPSSVRPASR